MTGNPHIGSSLEDFLKEEGTCEGGTKAALTAWNHYQATGLHVTNVEADGWLAQLEAGERATPPKPHTSVSRPKSRNFVKTRTSSPK